MSGRWLQLGLPIVLVWASGCAWWPRPDTLDLGQERHDRKREAIEEFESRRNEAQLLAARHAWDQGDAEHCRESLESLLGRDPQHREAGLLQVELELLEGNLAHAQAAVERLATAYPGDPEVLLANESVRLAAQQPAHPPGLGEAIELDRPPVPGDLVGDEPEIFLASQAELTEMEPGPPSPRDSGVRHASSYEGDSPRVTVVGGTERLPAPRRSQSGTGAAHPGRSDGAAARATARHSLTDEQARILEQAHLQWEQGNPDAAREQIERILTDHPDDLAVTMAAGVWALRHEQPEWAIAWMAPRRAVGARSAAFQRVLGTAYLRADQAAQAEEYLRRSLRLDSSAGLTYFLLGSCLERLGKTEAAERHFAQAARLEPRLTVRR